MLSIPFRARRWRASALAMLLVACSRGSAPAADTAPDSGRADPGSGDWIDLLPGSAAPWRGYRADTLPSGWQYDAASGVLTRAARGGDIVTRAQFTDFEFELEWRVGPRGNSGVFYRATEGTTRVYENCTEFQILDNAGHPDGRNPLTSAGSNFALIAASADVTRPIGEWNQARIVARGAHVEHWLNGTKVVEYELWTPEWAAKVKASKFNQWPSYGLAKRGHLGLQDHGDVVSFRRMRVRELSR